MVSTLDVASVLMGVALTCATPLAVEGRGICETHTCADAVAGVALADTVALFAFATVDAVDTFSRRRYVSACTC